MIQLVLPGLQIPEPNLYYFLFFNVSPLISCYVSTTWLRITEPSKALGLSLITVIFSLGWTARSALHPLKFRSLQFETSSLSHIVWAVTLTSVLHQLQWIHVLLSLEGLSNFHSASSLELLSILNPIPKVTLVKDIFSYVILPFHLSECFLFYFL